METVGPVSASPFTLPANVNTTTTRLELPPSLLQWVNSTTHYRANFTATFTDGPYVGVSKIASIVLRPTLPNIIVDIVGGDRVTSRSVDITIDGSKSRDPAFPTATLTYAWTCRANNGVTCPSIASGVSSFVLRGAELVWSATYTLTLNVTVSCWRY